MMWTFATVENDPKPLCAPASSNEIESALPCGLPGSKCTLTIGMLLSFSPALTAWTSVTFSSPSSGMVKSEVLAGGAGEGAIVGPSIRDATAAGAGAKAAAAGAGASAVSTSSSSFVLLSASSESLSPASISSALVFFKLSSESSDFFFSSSSDCSFALSGLRLLWSCVASWLAATAASGARSSREISVFSSIFSVFSSLFSGFSSFFGPFLASFSGVLRSSACG
mmetsp:Transcript_29948/g.45115  ORF Transcript_29948/g.45115 Transcript_29948/m.45115 type:complete len:225 (-) Transcript_29948:96-770(-)